MLLAIVGNPTENEDTTLDGSATPWSNKVTVGLVQQHTFSLMKEFNAKGGIVNLRKFKIYFDRNGLDTTAIQRSVDCLSSLLGSIKSSLPIQLPPNSTIALDEQNLTVPKVKFRINGWRDLIILLDVGSSDIHGN